ncbi:MAG: hypothetical protein BGO51_22850 [Rhodospirillales bacterium 69-11]|nr:type II toxin-antitoxin system prevent-host-death family antitoxin [Rhodospirillales bacterium]MBN8928681.1 type II toxin-antitoxin system prevent-host-death family antitoxin [Rhodospirillales bacterium]OJW31440.1 MAG: hypothetical protein BGO51_22850 [Rhodospirillales bacterium 69-11]
MTKKLTLREVDLDLDRCIRAVEAGEEFVITRDGKPVARLAPVGGKRAMTPTQQAAWDELRAAMDTGWALDAAPVDRDTLHER